MDLVNDNQHLNPRFRPGWEIGKMSCYSSVNKVGAILLALAVSITVLATLAAPASADPGEASSTVGNLSSPRAGAATAMGLDGKIYIFGGFADTSWAGYLNTVLIFDPATGETTTGTNMPNAAVLSVVARVANGSFYVIGGLNSGGALLTVQIYNPVSDSWSAGSPMPFPEFWATGCVGADSRIYVFGGRYTGNTTQILNPSTNSWSFGQDLPTARFGASAALLGNGSMMVVGGSTTSTVYNLVQFYNPSANSWSAGVGMPDSRTHGELVVAANGHAYYFGGQMVWSINGLPAEIYSTFNRLDLSGGVAWASGPAQRLATFGICTDSIGRVYIVGGYDGTGIRTSVIEWVLYEISAPNKLVIISPGDGSIVSGNVVVSAEVVNKAVGNTTPLMAIDFLIDGILSETQSAGSSGSFLWDTTGLADGSVHALTVRGYLWGGGLTEDTVTVTVSSVSVEEMIAAMEQELADLWVQLASEDANVTAISMQVAIMQAKLDGIISGMTGLDAMAAALNATLEDLQLQLDALQEQINRVEDKADTAGTYGILTLILVAIVLVMLVLMFFMSRKKAA